MFLVLKKVLKNEIMVDLVLLNDFS